MIRYGIIVILLVNIVEQQIIIVLKKIKSKYIPIAFHNLRTYDSHFKVQNFKKYKEKIDIIANNTEKYMSISMDNSKK